MYICVTAGALGIVAGVVGSIVACCRRTRSGPNRAGTEADQDYLASNIQMEYIEGPPRYVTSIQDRDSRNTYMEGEGATPGYANPAAKTEQFQKE